MATASAETHELESVSMLDEIRRNAQHRLQEIEPLLEEAERLRDILSVLEQQSHAPARVRTPRTRASLGAPRAPKGANKRIILELIGRQPGITPAEISTVTGVKRTVVASTVSRLKRGGVLVAHEQGGVQLASGS
jgi:Winged helix-turn-helix DNA-binding